MRIRPLICAALLAPMLVSCDEDGMIVIGNPQRAELDLAITDAPTDLARVVSLRITGVELRHSDGEVVRVDFDPPHDVDILSLRGGATFNLLESERVPSGTYQSLRLLTDADRFSDASFVERSDTDGRFSLAVEADSGLTVTQSFELPRNGTRRLVVDIDLRKSLAFNETDAFFVLNPNLRLVDPEQTGAISGATPGCPLDGDVGAVYIFQGRNAPVDDLDGDAGDALTTADIDGNGNFTAPFLPAGNYTAAFTCEAHLDDPLSEENISFIRIQNVSVTRGETAQIGF